MGRIREHIGPKIQQPRKWPAMKCIGISSSVIIVNMRWYLPEIRHCREAILWISLVRFRMFLSTPSWCWFYKRYHYSFDEMKTFCWFDFYRSQIKEFEQEYRDVMLWFTKNKNGEVPVRGKWRKSDECLSWFDLYTDANRRGTCGT